MVKKPFGGKEGDAQISVKKSKVKFEMRVNKVCQERTAALTTCGSAELCCCMQYVFDCVWV